MLCPLCWRGVLEHLEGVRTLTIDEHLDVNGDRCAGSNQTVEEARRLALQRKLAVARADEEAWRMAIDKPDEDEALEQERQRQARVRRAADRQFLRDIIKRYVYPRGADYDRAMEIVEKLD